MQAPRDENHVPAVLLESDSTPGTVITAKGDQSTGRLLVSVVSASTLSHESPVSGVANGSNLVFVFSNNIGLLTLNGQVQQDGTDVVISPATTATFVIAPGPGSTIENYYIS